MAGIVGVQEKAHVLVDDEAMPGHLPLLSPSREEFRCIGVFDKALAQELVQGPSGRCEDEPTGAHPR